MLIILCKNKKNVVIIRKIGINQKIFEFLTIFFYSFFQFNLFQTKYYYYFCQKKDGQNFSH